MSDTDGVTTPLWTDERIDHVFGKETIGAMFVRGLRDDLTATAERIAELEAQLAEARKWVPSTEYQTGIITYPLQVVADWNTPEEDEAWKHLGEQR